MIQYIGDEKIVTKNSRGISYHTQVEVFGQSFGTISYSSLVNLGCYEGCGGTQGKPSGVLKCACILHS